ncbi:hypothetical protein [Hominifimenecus sp. rT4P-3]|uniref:hypothetical protein n=1 Tax=Hominifimenecus sp. rT4P-3 TaxID=3242979 RepID=UPI003DA36526
MNKACLHAEFMDIGRSRKNEQEGRKAGMRMLPARRESAEGAERLAFPEAEEWMLFLTL